MFIRDVYELKGGLQIIGEPLCATGSWNEATHFDIPATMPPDAAPKRRAP